MGERTHPNAHPHQRPQDEVRERRWRKRLSRHMTTAKYGIRKAGTVHQIILSSQPTVCATSVHHTRYTTYMPISTPEHTSKAFHRQSCQFQKWCHRSRRAFVSPKERCMFTTCLGDTPPCMSSIPTKAPRPSRLLAILYNLKRVA
jgi:hypothetical protein